MCYMSGSDDFPQPTRENKTSTQKSKSNAMVQTRRGSYDRRKGQLKALALDAAGEIHELQVGYTWKPLEGFPKHEVACRSFWYM